MIYYILLGRTYSSPEGKGTRGFQRPIRRCPTSPPPIPILKTATATGSPYTFRIVRRFFYVPQKLSTFKELWDGTSSSASLSQMTRTSNHLLMKCTRAALSPQLFKDPEGWSGRSLGVSESRTHDLPHHSPVHNQVSNRHSHANKAHCCCWPNFLENRRVDLK